MSNFALCAVLVDGPSPTKDQKWFYKERGGNARKMSLNKGLSRIVVRNVVDVFKQRVFFQKLVVINMYPSIKVPWVFPCRQVESVWFLHGHKFATHAIKASVPGI